MLNILLLATTLAQTPPPLPPMLPATDCLVRTNAMGLSVAHFMHEHPSVSMKVYEGEVAQSIADFVNPLPPPTDYHPSRVIAFLGVNDGSVVLLMLFRDGCLLNMEAPVKMTLATWKSLIHSLTGEDAT